MRSITPGAPGQEFPPSASQPGAIGDSNYSPLVQVLNAGGVIYNAPIVAFNVTADQINFPNGNVDYSKVHDQVVAIDPVNMTVTLNLINGFSFGRPVWYLSMDTSIPLGAAIEHNTFAPLMAALPLGRDDSFSSPIERIFIATNGPEQGGCANPLRQGLSADLADGFRPNNVVGGIPTIALDYSPVWDAQLYEWTQDAITRGFRGQLREEFQILTFVQDGLITARMEGGSARAAFPSTAPSFSGSISPQFSQPSWRRAACLATMEFFPVLPADGCYRSSRVARATSSTVGAVKQKAHRTYEGLRKLLQPRAEAYGAGGTQ